MSFWSLTSKRWASTQSDTILYIIYIYAKHTRRNLACMYSPPQRSKSILQSTWHKQTHTYTYIHTHTHNQHTHTQDLASMKSLQLRYFTEREVSNIMGFPPVMYIYLYIYIYICFFFCLPPLIRVVSQLIYVGIVCFLV